jgi:AcrR family transcriptional regulator
MPPNPAKAPGLNTRDPERTRQRILEAALHEFAARGFAGARVDAIARRAGSNKRMLYHYFGDKEGLFRAVLRHKVNERNARVEALAAGRDYELPLWFEQNCRDAEWVRLLAWESLESKADTVVEEADRRRLAMQAAERIRQRQAAGRLPAGVPPSFLQLFRASLAMFPLAMPQMARIITGRSPHDPKFQREYAQFLETIAAALRPARPPKK